MSLNQVDAKTEPGASADSPQVWSITWRLTSHYVVCTAALLILVGGFLYWTLKRNLDQTRHALLASKIEVFTLLLRDPAKAAVLTNEVEHEASENHPLNHYVRILDGQGRILLETPGLDYLLPVAAFPPPTELFAITPVHVRQILREQEPYLLLSIRVGAGLEGREVRVVQMALDISTGAAMLADYRRKILLVLGLGVAFAAVAAFWIARKGMQPLVEITHTAQHITAAQLHQRIAGTQWPAELAKLAAAFDAMLDRLEDSFTRLSQFSADLAHELRTPINNLRGEAEVALSKTRTWEEYRQVIESSLEEYARLAHMIDGLLFLARAENPETQIQRVQLDARKEIEAVLEFHDPVAQEQGIQVT